MAFINSWSEQKETRILKTIVSLFSEKHKREKLFCISSKALCGLHQITSLSHRVAKYRSKKRNITRGEFLENNTAEFAEPTFRQYLGFFFSVGKLFMSFSQLSFSKNRNRETFAFPMSRSFYFFSSVRSGEVEKSIST